MITKSGGNEFHGGVFGYYNDTGMRAELDNVNARELRHAGVLRDRRRAVPEQRPLEGRADRSGVSTSAASRGRTRSGSSARTTASDQPEPADARRAEPDDVRARVPDQLLPEQVLGQADLQHPPGHQPRRHRLLRLADAGRRRQYSDQLEPDHLQWPPRHGRAGLRRPVEPALRLVRHPHAAVRAARGPVDDLPRNRSTCRSCSITPAPPTGTSSVARDGFGSVFGPTRQQFVQARDLRGVFHRLRGQPRDQGRWRLPEATTRSASPTLPATCETAFARASTTARNRRRATATSIWRPFYTNPTTGQTRQVFYQHDQLRREHVG